MEPTVRVFTNLAPNATLCSQYQCASLRVLTFESVKRKGQSERQRHLIATTGSDQQLGQSDSKYHVTSVLCKFTFPQESRCRVTKVKLIV